MIVFALTLPCSIHHEHWRIQWQELESSFPVHNLTIKINPKQSSNHTHLNEGIYEAQTSMEFGLCSKGCNTHQIRARLESLPGELLIDLSNRMITVFEDLCDNLVVI